MSMFSGLTNQISGWVANKKGQGEEGVDPQQMDPNQQHQNGGEVPVEGVEGEQAAGAGGMSGLAQGLMMKAMTAKEGLKEKAGSFAPPNLTGIGGNLMANVTNLIPGRKEEEVPTPPEPNPPSEMGGEMMIDDQQQQYAE